MSRSEIIAALRATVPAPDEFVEESPFGGPHTRFVWDVAGVVIHVPPTADPTYAIRQGCGCSTSGTGINATTWAALEAAGVRRVTS